MKRDLQRLKIAEKTIIEIEMRLNLIEGDLIVINSDLDYLNKIKEDLEYNIDLLKKEKIIAIASQYRRSINELAVVNTNIHNYENMKKALALRMGMVLKQHKEVKELHDNLKRALSDRKVILLFDPKRKKKRDNE